MFLLDAPYVSEFLKRSVERMGVSVLDTPGARRLTDGADIQFISGGDFSCRLAAGERVLANSENALAHIFSCGCHDDLVRQITVCKDKALFRETVAGLHPEYRFMRAASEDLAELDVSGMQTPFVVKPARGFFSLGVHVVRDHALWPEVVRAIEDERSAMNAEYPEEVVNADEYIVEARIEGKEYAIDVYYDEHGDPVITNILHHHFLSEDDISDTLYYTSAEIIETWLEPFTEYVARVGQACEFRNFPMHLEVRVDELGHILPIEANPLRFAGWCVADITCHAWGVDPYECYFKKMRPDWPSLLKKQPEKACVMVIAEVPGHMDRRAITKIDYHGLSTLFEEVLELRTIDYTQYPVFAFAFARMSMAGLERLKGELGDDFSRFITTA